MNDENKHTVRENFLLSLLQKVVKEYKNLLELTRRAKPLKIIEIMNLSGAPGETKFAVQFTNKNCILKLTAAEIMCDNYDLNDFNDFHAEMIRQAAQGKLIEFLKISAEKSSLYKIVSKTFNRELQQYVFTIETKDKLRSTLTAEELSKDKKLLLDMNIEDIYDIGYTQGYESILKEKIGLLLEKRKI